MEKQLAAAREPKIQVGKDWITEREVCDLLGIKKSTLIQYIYSGRVSRDMYRVGVGGCKFFNREKIMGK
jgi:predicted site-specific integrase-resolvase